MFYSFQHSNKRYFKDGTRFGNWEDMSALSFVDGVAFCNNSKP